MKHTRYAIVRRVGVLLLAAASLALLMGAGESQEARVDYLGHQMMCVCGCNEILLECNHVGCTYSSREIDELKQMVAHGDSDKVIYAAFVKEYGPTVLAAPTTTGFNIVAWIMPFVVFGAGLAIVVFVVRTWKRRIAPRPVAGITEAPPEKLGEFRDRARKDTEL